ncbi:MAG: hypothetical protein LUC88_08225 [Prevotella sp.]|nr:hypothetical protein [Prevotella sp.]
MEKNERLARICWNTNNWRCPSGKDGKSKSKASSESINGYGHDEWLLDNTRIMPDGYHYGFLQPMNVKSGIYEHSVFDIHLFTISPTAQRVYVGCLHDAMGVPLEEGEDVYSFYEEQGWIEEMKQEVERCGCKFNKSNFKPEWLFNVKFKFEEATINFSNKPLIVPKSIGYRYKLLNMTKPLSFVKDEHGNVVFYKKDESEIR